MLGTLRSSAWGSRAAYGTTAYLLRATLPGRLPLQNQKELQGLASYLHCACPADKGRIATPMALCVGSEILGAICSYSVNDSAFQGSIQIPNNWGQRRHQRFQTQKAKGKWG